ncbi:fimbria/pilus periplasmic chaperone [Vibrio owensii]|uniref:fimbria/pilus periplasmic chaperone n=1 Tax=Vibrio owensii TaxID=696485 RepID=UPI0005F005F1|nr:fimbria/pilus periplasmic chaperone [Vibrio owensii]
MFYRSITYLALLLFSGFANAIIISPTVFELNTDSNTTSQIIVTNNSTEKMPLEVSIHQLVFKQNGQYKTKALNNDALLVFPPAAILAPNSKQVFRIQWLEPSVQKASSSYFIRFTQAHLANAGSHTVTLSGQQSGVKIKVHYNALLHVYSNNQQPDVTLEVSDAGQLVIRNTGERFTYSRRLYFEPLTATENYSLQQQVGDHFLPPFSSFTLRSRKAIPVGKYHGREQ